MGKMRGKGGGRVVYEKNGAVGQMLSLKLSTSHLPLKYWNCHMNYQKLSRFSSSFSFLK